MIINTIIFVIGVILGVAIIIGTALAIINQFLPTPLTLVISMTLLEILGYGIIYITA